LPNEIKPQKCLLIESRRNVDALGPPTIDNKNFEKCLIHVSCWSLDWVGKNKALIKIME